MNKEQAIDAFWNSFGLNAYDEGTVMGNKTTPEFPYITYNLSTDYIGNEVPMSASLWYKSNSWKEVSEKAKEIGDAISLGGVLLEYDNGVAWIKREVPFSQRAIEETNGSIRRVILQISAEYISAD